MAALQKDDLIRGDGLIRDNCKFGVKRCRRWLDLETAGLIRGKVLLGASLALQGVYYGCFRGMVLQGTSLL